MTGRTRTSLLVLGLGNVLCGDDGAGPAVVARLAARYEAPPGVRIVDGGTLGLSLLSILADVPAAIVVDAVQVAGRAPGELVRLLDDDVSTATREQLSVHQVGVADLLDALRLLDRLPRRLVLHGVVPGSLALAYGCTPVVAAVLDELVERVRAEAAAFGFPLLRRAGTAAATGSEERTGAAVGPRRVPRRARRGDGDAAVSDAVDHPRG